MKSDFRIALAQVAFAAAVLLAVQGTGRAQQGVAPFKVKPDGSVAFSDLMELTKQPTVADRITDEELGAIKARHKIQYGAGFTPTEQPELPPRGDLYTNSVLLSDGKNHTLLPMNSLMRVPDNFKSRVVDKPVGKLVLWPEFSKQNRAWVRGQEITFDNATGKTPLSEATLLLVEKTPAIVVSVVNGFPIGVKPQPEAGEAGAGAEAPSGAAPKRPR